MMRAACFDESAMDTTHTRGVAHEAQDVIDTVDDAALRVLALVGPDPQYLERAGVAQRRAVQQSAGMMAA
jgi:hypothetical protein